MSGPRKTLDDVLGDAQKWGTLGRRPVSEVISHARQFLAPLVDCTGPVIDIGTGGGVPGLVIAVDHSACILCDRCVRGCNEIRNNQVLGRAGKGYGARVAFEGALNQDAVRRLYLGADVFALASFAAYAVGQLLDIFVFDKLRRLKAWWVAPAASTSAMCSPSRAKSADSKDGRISIIWTLSVMLTRHGKSRLRLRGRGGGRRAR